LGTRREIADGVEPFGLAQFEPEEARDFGGGRSQRVQVGGVFVESGQVAGPVTANVRDKVAPDRLPGVRPDMVGPDRVADRDPVHGGAIVLSHADTKLDHPVAEVPGWLQPGKVHRHAAGLTGLENARRRAGGQELHRGRKARGIGAGPEARADAVLVERHQRPITAVRVVGIQDQQRRRDRHVAGVGVVDVQCRGGVPTQPRWHDELDVELACPGAGDREAVREHVGRAPEPGGQHRIHAGRQSGQRKVRRRPGG